MSGIRAKVQNGRLVLDQPTSLPEGTEIDLAVVDPGDDLDDAQREQLHAAIRRGIEDGAAGRTTAADTLIAELQRKR